MRVLALHPDVIVFVSRAWQTTCTAVRSSDEGFVIDSLVYPDELEALPEVTEQAGFPVSGLLATHADWDHLLGRLAFSDAALGVAESSAARLRAAPGEAQRALRYFDEEHYVARPSPLALGSVQELPVPGRLSVGSTQELELHPAAGHTADGMAVLVPWARILICGDYLSPVEIPMLSAGGSPAVYAATLERLGELLKDADWVVPGHGAPLPRAEAERLHAEDVAYLDALRETGPDPRLPEGRRTRRQLEIHAENVRHATEG